MRILMSSSTYWPAMNGQAIFTVSLAEGLAGRGHDVTVLFASDRGASYRDTRHGVKLEHVRSIQLSRFHPNVGWPTPTRGEISRIFDTAHPEVVHIQDHYSPSGLMLAEAQRRGLPLVGTNHFMPENVAPYIPLPRSIKPRLFRMLWAWMLSTYNRMDVVTVQSRAAAELIRARGLIPPVHAISCGIDLQRFHPDPSVDRAAARRRFGLDPQRKLFLFVGRVDGEKRVDVLLHALARLPRDDIQLAVAGQGAAAKQYRWLAERLELGDKVRFTGFIPNEELHILLNSVDVFTMPSEAELLSIASLEAMACGRPLLLADAVALPELVTPGENGYLFRPGDPADAARCMAELADHPERWEGMGAASVRRAQAHGLERTISRYEEIYGF